MRKKKVRAIAINSFALLVVRDLLSTEDHVTRLLSPAHTAGCGIRPIRWTYAPSHFLF